MFPEDRFNPLLPNAEKLHEDLWEAAELEFTPRTSRELGSKLVLHQFLPAWDVQAYIRVAKLQLHVHNSKYPSYEATGELPQLNDGNFLVPKEEILMHLQTFHKDIDEFLTDEQRSESFAYRSMISEKLHRVMLYCRWVDPVTYREVTRPQTKKYIPFPLNQFLPKKIHMDTMTALQQFGITTKEQAYVIARDCYTALNAKLASSKGAYFFGDRPSALDVAVFGHIVDALGNVQLGATVYQHAPLLVTLAEKIRDAYFASPGETPGSLSAESLATYTENQTNYFSTLDNNSFMNHVAPSMHVAFLEPYRSLNWGRRELAQDIAAKKKHDANAATGENNANGGEGFEKGTRNVIIGAIAAILLYAFAALPLQFKIVDDEDDEDDEDLDDEDFYDDDE
uniref:GST C-terminal domain-containing protein n=1 Tax=Globisporangium ultimum (strain ATCC 200006 / CBS 805.95 / DAOM BR144) TaxID=431595 RepID=K3X9M3_GLOUD